MLWIGTSGFVYRDWSRVFYPEGLPTRAWLGYYAQVFRTCELNATFYRLPTPEAVDRWRESTPEGFLFACKGSRFLTHMKRLKDSGQGLRRYFERVDRLGRRRGPVLWQLPPGMRLDLPRLEAFLEALPPGRHAFEFRSPEWYVDPVADLLDHHGAAFCEHDLVNRPPPRLTGGWRYLRFHGATGKYQGRYGRGRLRKIAANLTQRRGDAYAYFNNDYGGNAILDAMDLLDLTGQPAAAISYVTQPAAVTPR